MKNGQQDGKQKKWKQKKGRIKKFLALIPFSMMESDDFWLFWFTDFCKSKNIDFLKVLEFTDPSNSLQKFPCYFFLPKGTYRYEWIKGFLKGILLCRCVSAWPFVGGRFSWPKKSVQLLKSRSVCRPRGVCDMAQHKTENIWGFSSFVTQLWFSKWELCR